MMKKKIITTIAALSMTASMTMPVFAANANNQTLEIPVVGQVGRWKPGNNEVPKPSNVTDINVSVPTSMTFNVVTNTTNSEPAFASAEYTVTNNGEATVNMQGKYQVISGDVKLVAKDSVSPKGGDSNINLALDLKYGTTTPDQNFITNVINEAQSQKIAVKNGTPVKLQFTSDAQGMEDIKQEALKGTFSNQTKITKGTLVLTFQAQGAQ